MQWDKITMSDDTRTNVTSIDFGNGYYTALSVRFVNDEYHIDILYTDNLANEWNTKTLYDAGADHVNVAGIVFAGGQFVVPFASNLSKSFYVITFARPTDDNIPAPTRKFAPYAYPILLNSVRYVGHKVIVCGSKQESDDIYDYSGCIWYCADLVEEWEEYVVVEATEDVSGNALAVIADTHGTYKVYVLETPDNTTNYHKIYSSVDLEDWGEPAPVSQDNLDAPPFPAFAYCEDYDAVALFLHGNIYISKAGQAFVAIPYPGGIGMETIRTATSDGTKFLASSASLNQTDLKVLYSSGDPTVAENWHIQTLAEGTQISSDVKFIDDTDLFVVVAGHGDNLKPSVYVAAYNASKFTTMRDRVPTYPGRVSLTSLGGNLYTLARADEPTEVGTKLSKVNLLSDDAALAVWNNTPPNILCTPSTALEHIGNNAFHVGDILTTARDLSGDANWLKCTGGDISFDDYPELYPLLPTGSIEDEWDTNVIGSDPMTSTSDCGVATDGEWYVMVATNQSTHYWYVYYTNDPASDWTKKTIAAATGKILSGGLVHLIHAKGYFSFLARDGQGQSFVVYTADPSGEWNTMQIGSPGWVFDQFKYVNNTYIATATYQQSNIYYTVAVTFNELGGVFTANTLQSNQTAPVYAHDIDYYDGKWYAIWWQLITSSGSYNSITRLYYADALTRVYAAGNYATVEDVSGIVQEENHFVPQNLTCDHGYYVLWGRHAQPNNSGRFEMYYSNDLYTFTKSSKPDYWGLASQASVPIFFGGAFYIALPGVNDHKPYILYGEDPANLTAKLLFNDVISRARLTASDASRTVFAGTQSNDYNTFTAAWQKAGKSLPKLTPGEGLNAYIKAKEGD